MFSHYIIDILPFTGQDKDGNVGLKTPDTTAQKTVKVQPKRDASSTPLSKVNLKKPREKVSALNSEYKSGNIGILDTLSPRSKKSSAQDYAVNIEAKDIFTEESLTKQIKLFAHKKKKEEGADSLFSTLTSCKLTIHDEVNLKLHVLNAVQTKQLDLIRMELLAHLKKGLNNGAITFDYSLEEKAEVPVASFTDKKSKFDELAITNPSLDKFRKLFNLDIEY